MLPFSAAAGFLETLLLFKIVYFACQHIKGDNEVKATNFIQKPDQGQELVRIHEQNQINVKIHP